jgi:hypothetical protein
MRSKLVRCVVITPALQARFKTEIWILIDPPSSHLTETNTAARRALPCHVLISVLFVQYKAIG